MYPTITEPSRTVVKRCPRPRRYPAERDSRMNGTKQVHWADVLVDVHVYMLPPSPVLWRKFASTMMKAAKAIRQDVQL